MDLAGQLARVSVRAAAVEDGFTGRSFQDAVATSGLPPALGDGAFLVVEVPVDPPDADERRAGSPAALRLGVDRTGGLDGWEGSAWVAYVPDAGRWPARPDALVFFPTRRRALAWLVAVEELCGRESRELVQAAAEPVRWVNGRPRTAQDDALDVVLAPEGRGTRLHEQMRVARRGRERGGRGR